MRPAISALIIASVVYACGEQGSPGSAEAKGSPKGEMRADAIARAQVWQPTPVASMNIKAGHPHDDALPFHATVDCEYLPKQLSGASPKFACQAGADEELKVKYGGTNAEVYAEVAATRLLWALGFGADHMYPVRVICRGCPRWFGGILRESGEGNQFIFDPATVERKLAAREIGEDQGWGWHELDTVKEELGGAPRAHRDALKLLAVFLQHTDNKPAQQRLVCLDDGPADAPCRRPLMMMQDVGLTFGRANWTNANDKAMNLAAWSDAPIWRDGPGCVGNLPKSITGTLHNPPISEAGRSFLAGLLAQLTDQQIRDLFEVARVHLRLREPTKARSGFPTVEEWAAVFKDKRRQIAERRCA